MGALLRLSRPRLLDRFLGLLLTVVVLMGTAPLLFSALFLDLPSTTPGFDCDDSVLASYLRLESLGIKAVPVVGSLNATGESYSASNHVWLWVQVAGLTVALDWGTPWFDAQHYEGQAVVYPQLLDFVAQDRHPTAGSVAASIP